MFFSFSKIFENHPFLGVGSTQKVNYLSIESVELIFRFSKIFENYYNNPFLGAGNTQKVNHLRSIS